MTGQIDQNGTLRIQRAGKWVAQLCPFRVQNCGEDCPLFDEPKEDTGKTILKLWCSAAKMEMVFDEFEDRRG